MKKYLIVLLALLLSASISAQSISGLTVTPDKDTNVTYEDGTVIEYDSLVDWNRQKIEVTCRMEAELEDTREIVNSYTALKSLALKRAAEILNTINIDCKNTIESYKKLDSSFEQKLSKYLSEVDMVDKYYKNNVVSVTMQVSMAGKKPLIELFTDSYMETYSLLDIFDLLFPRLYAADNTGIIIDARGTGLKPALLPKVVTEKKDVYNPKDVSKKTLKEAGAAQYAAVDKKTSSSAIKKEALKQELEALKRTGPKPLIIKAYKTNGPLKTDAVISEKDAALLANSDALKKGKVTIIVDQSVGGTIGKKALNSIMLSMLNTNQ